MSASSTLRITARSRSDDTGREAPDTQASASATSAEGLPVGSAPRVECPSEQRSTDDGVVWPATSWQ